MSPSPGRPGLPGRGGGGVSPCRGGGVTAPQRLSQRPGTPAGLTRDGDTRGQAGTQKHPHGLRAAHPHACVGGCAPLAPVGTAASNGDVGLVTAV